MPGSTTRERLLHAAAELFAAHGFHGTKMRDIARHGGVNLAAANYHYGSKKALYIEVLRKEFGRVRAVLTEHGLTRSPRELALLPRAELIELLRRRTRVMLKVLVGPPPSLHGTLMQREMLDPSEALPLIVDEFMRPMLDELGEVIAALAPGLDATAVERCAFSVVGQVLFYRITMPALLHLGGRRRYGAGFVAATADHITEFTLGGLQHLAAANHGRKRRAQ
jgi:AcrR family transcriptional regulator